MKKFLSVMLACSVAFTTPVYSATYGDSYILRENVSASYNGHKDGSNLNKELMFLDLKSTYGFDIAKLGSLNFIKGYERNFAPNNTATNLDVLSILLNMEGYEPQALSLSVDYQDRYPEFNSLEAKNLAYIELATLYGYITEREGRNALKAYGASNFMNLQRNQGPKQQNSPDVDNFTIKNPATRINVAEWINIYLQNVQAVLPQTPNVGEYSVSDHTGILAYQIPYVETVLANGIMSNVDGKFAGDKTLTKGELAHTLVSLEPYYSDHRGFVTTTGVVSAIKKDTNNSTGLTTYNVYIRGTDGKVYDLSTVKYSKGGLSTEIPTYKNGKMINNFSLAVNDVVEFVTYTGTGVNPTFEANTALFTGVLESNDTAYAVGKLKDVDLVNGTISIDENKNNDILKTYQMIDGLYNSSGLMLGIGTEYELYAPDEIPYGAKYKLTLKGDVVTDIKYIGQDTIIDERRGIIIENEPSFGYMVVLGMDNVKRVYKYHANDITVEKQPYYDHEDYVGNYDEFFKYDGYDPRDATVYDIEAGDLVFLRPNAKDNQFIDYISVTPNYIQKTGVVNKVAVNDGYTTVLVTYDNGLVSNYQIPDDVLVRKDGSIRDASYLEVGDHAKFLINEAIIDSGYIVESVKEVLVEEQGHEISNIVKGQLTGYNAIQGELSLTDAQTLEKTGWDNRNNMSTYSLKPNDKVDVYINDTKTNVTNFNRLLKNNKDFEVYMALEQNYSGENVKFITAYDGRDTLIKSDMITNIGNNGKIILQNKADEYDIKNNGIVVKNNKLVTKSSLQPYDLVQVALNGGDASVIKVLDSIDNTGIQVARGRIQSVDENVSFTVKSLVLLENNKWTYSPIERTYAIDGDTVFLTAEGTVKDINEFIGYTDTSVINNVYNIISDGSYAKFIIESPYTNEDLNGTVYKVEDDVVYLKDVSYFDKEESAWRNVSLHDNTATINFMPNSVTIKNGEVVSMNKIENGDRLFIKTDVLNHEDGETLNVTGYINFIEN